LQIKFGRYFHNRFSFERLGATSFFGETAPDNAVSARAM
jgi:hypothetical protein